MEKLQDGLSFAIHDSSTVLLHVEGGDPDTRELDSRLMAAGMNSCFRFKVLEILRASRGQSGYHRVPLPCGILSVGLSYAYENPDKPAADSVAASSAASKAKGFGHC